MSSSRRQPFPGMGRSRVSTRRDLLLAAKRYGYPRTITNRHLAEKSGTSKAAAMSARAGARASRCREVYREAGGPGDGSVTPDPRPSATAGYAPGHADDGSPGFRRVDTSEHLFRWYRSSMLLPFALVGTVFF